MNNDLPPGMTLNRSGRRRLRGPLLSGALQNCFS